MKLCALHTAAASLVRESCALHGVRANAGFDVPLGDSCFGDVSGNLQVDTQRDSACCETDLLREMLEVEAVPSSMAESDRLFNVSECLATSSLVAESDRLHERRKSSLVSLLEAGSVRPSVVLECSSTLSSAAETDQLHKVLESSVACARLFGDSALRSRVRGLRLRQEAHSRSGSFVENSSLSSHHVDHLHTRSVCCAHGEHDLHDARTNSCLGSHVARVNSPGLWSWGRNKAKEYEYSGPGRVSCC